MKTPKEILLAKHQSAETKLDRIRRGVVRQLNPAPQPGFGARLAARWRELITPQPQRWAALAGLWIVIGLIKFSTPDNRAVAARQNYRSPEMTVELKEQQAFFGELAGLPPMQEAQPPRTLPPRPRSSRNPEFHRA